MRSSVVLFIAAIVATSLARRTRSPVPFELYRDNVEPAKGGKVPEAAHMRIELNKLDSAGLETGEGLKMMEHLMHDAPSLVLPEHHAPGSASAAASSSSFPSFFDDDFSSNFPSFDSHKISPKAPRKPNSNNNPYEIMFNSLFDDPFPDKESDYFDDNSGYTPPLKLKPNYAPAHPEPLDPRPPAPLGYSPPSYPAYTPAPYNPPASYAPASYAPPAYSPPAYTPASYAPPAYSPETYSPPAYAAAPEPYAPPAYAAPEPYVPPKPVGPVLLEKRPYEVKSVQPLPITVADSYTGFDCRAAPYPDRFYADPETGCETYHFCHASGQQDTFHCGYGTVFNDQIGTCDYRGNTHCAASQGHGPAHPPQAPYAPAPAPYAPAPAPYTPKQYQPNYPTSSYGRYDYKK